MKMLLVMNLAMMGIVTFIIAINDCGSASRNKIELAAKLEQCKSDIDSIIGICIGHEQNHGGDVQGQ